ncbi:carboxymuconolactone decarboxylase family protein [Salinimonas marina]|uniref:Carboxymuconolactone decarboxylase family protein n=1 Tax=Salinimonas marina TaxID=2785918 RepID=A0A7S9HEM5_9ALTE|nr:carboxymuconolactone decarboxylase family protein [Salinimonas marina]QPG07042.1 carboxymuconolactone decarboxylase family protein [Salinimonas marina]
MPLVPPLSSEANPEVADMASFFNETLGFCPNSVLTMMRRPEIAKAFINLNMAVMDNQGAVTSAFKRLIAYVSSNVSGCRYCQAHTIRAAERYNAEPDQLDHVWEYQTHPSFSEAERAALDLAVAASTIPNAVDAPLIKRMNRYWSENDIVEIMGVIALFGYLNRWNDSMATTIEPDAIRSGEILLANTDWETGKHR